MLSIGEVERIMNDMANEGSIEGVVLVTDASRATKRMPTLRRVIVTVGSERREDGRIAIFYAGRVRVWLSRKNVLELESRGLPYFAELGTFHGMFPGYDSEPSSCRILPFTPRRG